MEIIYITTTVLEMNQHDLLQDHTWVSEYMSCMDINIFLIKIYM